MLTRPVLERIPLRPYAIAHAGAIDARRPRTVTRFGRNIVLFRDRNGAVVAADAACPHRGADLGLGRIVDGELECGYHGFRFGADGGCSRAPCATLDRAMPKRLHLTVLPIVELGGFVWMRPDAQPLSADDIPGREVLIDDAWHHARGEMTWNARLGRTVESMLDFHHVEFAHRRFMGGFDRFVKHDVRVDGERITLDATLAHRRFGWEISGSMQAWFPATMRLGIGRDFAGLVMLCPVDGERTWIGIRYFQTRVRWSPWSKLLAEFSLWSELRFIQPDDARMSSSAVPRSGDVESSTLLEADRAIVEWYRLRKRAVERDRDEREKGVEAGKGIDCVA
ncbi:MAG: Rieske 2Fe-2S domain-containing protein [Polyangiaceae bacterium]|nr:Rieske 2Fe-2S domain-containing protein [Polyangiaceae bacterium]